MSLFEKGNRELQQAIEQLGEIRARGESLRELNSVYELLQAAQRNINAVWIREGGVPEGVM